MKMILIRQMTEMEIKTITLPTRQIEVEVYAPAQTSEKLPQSYCCMSYLAYSMCIEKISRLGRSWLFGLCTQFV